MSERNDLLFQLLMHSLVVSFFFFKSSPEDMFLLILLRGKEGGRGRERGRERKRGRKRQRHSNVRETSISCLPDTFPDKGLNP